SGCVSQVECFGDRGTTCVQVTRPVRPRCDVRDAARAFVDLPFHPVAVRVIRARTPVLAVDARAAVLVANAGLVARAVVVPDTIRPVIQGKTARRDAPLPIE